LEKRIRKKALAIVCGISVAILCYCVGGLFLLPAVNIFKFEQRGFDKIGCFLVPSLIGFLIAYALYRAGRPEAIDVNHCKNCGYDLTGNRSGCCPECGYPSFHAGA